MTSVTMNSSNLLSRPLLGPIAHTMMNYSISASPSATTTIVQVVTDDDKMFDAMHFVEGAEMDGLAMIECKLKALHRAVEKLFKNKKVMPPPQPWIQFAKCKNIPDEILIVDPKHRTKCEYVVVYHKKDFATFLELVKEAGASGAFVICVDNAKEAAQVSKMFEGYTSVDIVARDVCMSDDFTYILVSSVLKRALREVGFMA